MTGELPIYYAGDEEVILRAGRLKDGRLLAGFFNFGYDPLEELDLVLDFTPKEITYLAPNGKEMGLEYTQGGAGKV